MDGSEFLAHRRRTLDVFKSAGITEGVILYQSLAQPKEPFSDVDCTNATGWERKTVVDLIPPMIGQLQGSRIQNVPVFVEEAVG
jgi:hypothetical protein